MEGEMVMKEVTPKELQKLNAESFKDTQKIFRRRLREIAKGGENKAKYNENDYCAGDYIAGWLRTLGFTVKRIGTSGWHEITWPKKEDIIEKFCSEQAQILTSLAPEKVHYAIGWLNSEEKKKVWHMMAQRGDRKQCHPEADCLKSGKPAWYLYHWKDDPIQWDYICSCCDEHSEYRTKFCPNCGAKMQIEKENE
jgi:hypothetical protein